MSWFDDVPLVYDVSLHPRGRRSMRYDPDYIRVANRIEAERQARRPVVMSAKTKLKMKRRAKNKAARKARKK